MRMLQEVDPISWNVFWKSKIGEDDPYVKAQLKSHFISKNVVVNDNKPNLLVGPYFWQWLHVLWDGVIERAYLPLFVDQYSEENGLHGTLSEVLANAEDLDLSTMHVRPDGNMPPFVINDELPKVITSPDFRNSSDKYRYRGALLSFYLDSAITSLFSRGDVAKCGSVKVYPWVLTGSIKLPGADEILGFIEDSDGDVLPEGSKCMFWQGIQTDNLSQRAPVVPEFCAFKLADAYNAKNANQIKSKDASEIVGLVADCDEVPYPIQTPYTGEDKANRYRDLIYNWISISDNSKKNFTLQGADLKANDESGLVTPSCTYRYTWEYFKVMQARLMHLAYTPITFDNPILFKHTVKTITRTKKAYYHFIDGSITYSDDELSIKDDGTYVNDYVVNELYKLHESVNEGHLEDLATMIQMGSYHIPVYYPWENITDADIKKGYVDVTYSLNPDDYIVSVGHLVAPNSSNNFLHSIDEVNDLEACVESSYRIEKFSQVVLRDDLESAYDRFDRPSNDLIQGGYLNSGASRLVTELYQDLDHVRLTFANPADGDSDGGWTYKRSPDFCDKTKNQYCALSVPCNGTSVTDSIRELADKCQFALDNLFFISDQLSIPCYFKDWGPKSIPNFKKFECNIDGTNPFAHSPSHITVRYKMQYKQHEGVVDRDSPWFIDEQTRVPQPEQGVDGVFAGYLYDLSNPENDCVGKFIIYGGRYSSIATKSDVEFYDFKEDSTKIYTSPRLLLMASWRFKSLPNGEISSDNAQE